MNKYDFCVYLRAFSTLENLYLISMNKKTPMVYEAKELKDKTCNKHVNR